VKATTAISGYVLKLCRESLDLSQEQLAELAAVERNTVQGWESGRRPLANVQVVTLLRLRDRLRALGVRPQFLTYLTDALDADYILNHILAADVAEPSIEAHPLATYVLPRSSYDLLAWPLDGPAPPGLARIDRASRRGPVPRGPELSAGERDKFFDQLRRSADLALREEHDSAVLLRRQVYYLLTWRGSSDDRAWLAEAARIEERQLRDTAVWSAGWAAVRSHRVARARLGDPEPLRHFIRTAIASEQCRGADLIYQSYWAGEIATRHHSDEFMVTEDIGTWPARALLRRLTASLDPGDPVLDLYINSLWALLRRRGDVLATDPAAATALQIRTREVLDGEGPGARARAQLEQIRFALEAHHQR
jgi:transcriptional regulator with XRE-family HTH domain